MNPLTRSVWIAILLLCGCAPVVTPAVLPARGEAIPATAVKMTPELDLYPPVLHSDEWLPPVPLPGPVNTAGAEDAPFVSADGMALFFFFTPDASVPAEKQLLDGVTGIYAAERSGGGWDNVRRILLQDPGRLALDGCPFADGGTLWFCSAREGYEGIHWFTAEFGDGAWRNWRYAEGQFDPQDQVGELHLSADGSELYFHSARAGGAGGLDIWMLSREGGGWGEPVNITAVNSPEDDSRPFLTPDGGQLWFTRTYQGSPAIFRSLRVDGQWTAPELIVSQFAGEPTLDSQGNLYFVHHFLQDGRMIEADIYVAYRKQ